MIAARYPRKEVADREIFWSTLVGLQLKYLYGVIERKSMLIKLFLKLIFYRTKIYG